MQQAGYRYVSVPPAKRLDVAIGDKTLSLSNLDKVLYPRADSPRAR